MTIISRTIEALTKAPNTERLPQTQQGFGGLGGFQAGAARESTLSMMTASSHLFSVIDRIASSTAAVDWQLFREMANGDREEITSHPLLTLWNAPNPFYSLFELIETLDQHFELVGEQWIVKVRGAGIRVPTELWAVRPDRMAPVIDRDEFISGYMYIVGNERIPLDVDDVIFIRRPDPMNPYRGIGVVQSMLPDLLSERSAARWTDAFFQNSAMPGGIIEVDETVSDADFQTMLDRWRQQHQGVNNAHRVAFLERGKWKTQAFSQRDMQFTDLRKMNRDIIFGAFGMPLSVMGVTESVNRANAEAGQVMFFENIVIPRLVRIRNEINQNLVPEFGEDLILDYVDPTPQNRELALNEATQGYTTGLLTRNEGRAKMGEGEVDGGDEFIPTPQAPGATNLSITMPEQKALKAADTARPEDVDDEATDMEKAWARRLTDEAEALIEYVGQFA